jgi:hypothetical protein
MKYQLFTHTLPQQTVQLVTQFQEKRPAFLSSFYLSGGTGLALQLGHRESEDLDFFSQESFSPQQIEQDLFAFGSLSQTELTEGTLNTYLQGVKLQFLEYPYTLLEPFTVWNGIQISSVLDIACTKLQTIGLRGSKKDFVDLYFLLEHYTLEDLLQATAKKYSQSDYSQTHIMKSLVYFVDAEDQPMPRMHKSVEWSEIKSKMIATVKSVSLT